MSTVQFILLVYLTTACITAVPVKKFPAMMPPPVPPPPPPEILFVKYVPQSEYEALQQQTRQRRQINPSAVSAEKIPGLRPPGIQPPPPPIFFTKSVPRTEIRTRQRRGIIELEMIAPTYTLPEIYPDLTINNPDLNIGSGGGLPSHFFTTPFNPSLTGTQFVVHNFNGPQHTGQIFNPQFLPQIKPYPSSGRPYPPSRSSPKYGVQSFYG